MRWLDGITDSMDMSLNTEIVEDRDIGLLQVMGLQRLNSNINILQETLTTVGICQVE